MPDSLMEVFMNYIELINNFWIANRVHNFNSLETSLYFFILDYANNARWPVSFNLPNGIIQSVFGCTRDQLTRARKKLCKCGLLYYETGDRHNPGKYRIIAHPTPTRDLPEANSRATQETPMSDLSTTASHEPQNSVEETVDPHKTYSRPTQDLPETYPTPTSNINKTKLKKRKQEITELPYGNSSARLTGEGRISGEENVNEPFAVKGDESQALDNSRANVSYESTNKDQIEDIKEINPATRELCAQTVDGHAVEADGAVPYELIRRAFIDLCPSLPAPKESGLWSQARKRLIRCRWKEYPSLEFWEDYFNKVESSDFLSGRVTRWRADFDWLMKPSNFEKVLEGKYANRQEKVTEVLRQFMEAG